MNTATTLIVFLLILGAIFGLFYFASTQQIAERSGLAAEGEAAIIIAADIPTDALPTANSGTTANSSAGSSSSRVVSADQTFPSIDHLASNVKQTLQASLAKLRLDQNQQATEELNTLLTEYQELDATTRFAVIGSYVNYYLSVGNLDSVVQLYEEALKIPDLANESAIRVNRDLGQIAFRQGRIQEGVSHYDQVFSMGGKMSKVVSLTLARVLYDSEDYDRAGRYLEEHLDFLLAEGVTIDPTRYELSYANLQDVVLKMSKTTDAIRLSQALIQQFNNINNWRNLAQIYQSNGDMNKFQATIKGATDNDFIDADGKWIDNY